MFRWFNTILSRRFPTAPILVLSVASMVGLLLLVLLAVPPGTFPTLGASRIVAYSFLAICACTIGAYTFVRHRSLHPEVRASCRESMSRDFGFTVLGLLCIALAVFLNYAGRNTLAIFHGGAGVLLATSAVYHLTALIQVAHRRSSAIKGVCHRCGCVVRGIPKRKCPECGEINITSRKSP
jgi:hypothetical protein